MSTGDNSKYVLESEDINQAIISLLMEEGESTGIIVRTLSNKQNITYEVRVTKSLFGNVKLSVEELAWLLKFRSSNSPSIVEIVLNG